MSARTLISLSLLVSLSASAAEDRSHPFAGTLLVGWSQRFFDGEPLFNERRHGGIAVMGTALYQWDSGVGLGVALGYDTFEVHHFRMLSAPCDTCAFERTEFTQRFTALEAGPVLRWALLKGKWRPSVQMGLGLALTDVSGYERKDGLPGATVHLGTGLEWWFSGQVPVALRAELRATAGAFIDTDYGHAAIWPSVLVGAGF